VGEDFPVSLKEMIRSIVPASLWGRLRVMRLRQAIAKFPARDVRHSYGGHELTIHLADGLAEGWYDHDWPEPAEIALLRQGKLRPGARVFNLGAHQGVIALMLARIVGPTGQVVAVEASAHNAAVGARNRKLNQADQLVVLHAAVGERAGTLTFGEGLAGQVDDGSGSWGRVEVPACSIDDLSTRFGPPDVLFIDVEGYEYRTLCGATQTLQRRPDCFVEVHVNEGLETFGGTAQKIVELFPAELYARYVGPPDGVPVAYTPSLGLPAQRFLLVAISHVHD
jgi:FkbM family methyltransferase